MTYYLLSFFAGAIVLAHVWAGFEIRRRAQRPHRQVIYRKGQPPQVIGV